MIVIVMESVVLVEIIMMATKTKMMNVDVKRARLVHFLVCRNPRQEGIRDKSA